MGSDNPPDTSLNVTVNAKNQVTSWCYDAAGNVVRSSPCPTSGSGTIGASAPNVYDGENRLINTIGGVTYDYGAGGERVEKSQRDGTGILYWYGPGGVLEETDLNGVLKNEYAFFGGKRVARYSAANGYSYYFSDHLGSADVVTDASGNIQEESDYYPFGGERVVTDSGIGNNYKFTGKERDPETGCDYFGARYYCNPIGRFITPDWAAVPTAVPYAHFGNPQSLNLYSYVQNNPTTFGDPDGHCSSGGKKQGFWWCVGHALGFNETQEEFDARIGKERQWLVDNVANGSDQVNALGGASASQIDGIYQKWDWAITHAQLNSGQQVIFGAQAWKRGANGVLALTLFRGGDFANVGKNEYKLDTNGNVKAGEAGRGPSVNTDPANIPPRFAENITEVKFIPPELTLRSIGGPGHFEIVPREPMSLSRYLELLERIVIESAEKPK